MSNVLGVGLFLVLCVLMSLGLGYVVFRQYKLLESFSEHLIGSYPQIGKLYLFYSEICPHTGAAKKIFDAIDTKGQIEKVEVNCSDAANAELCAREGIQTVPAFKVVTSRISARITNWRDTKEISDTLAEALRPISVNLVINN